MEKATVKFYGIKCKAEIIEDSFELFGKNKFTTFLIGGYSFFIMMANNMLSYICMILGIKYKSGLYLKIISEEGEK